MVSHNSAVQTVQSAKVEAEAVLTEKRKEEAKQVLYIARV
jgi:hypothetical protein